MKTVVSVCMGHDYDDWKASIPFKFGTSEEAISFLKISLSQGFLCLVYEEE